MDILEEHHRRNSYTADGNEAFDIRLIRNPGDLHSLDCSFKPDMCHQIFGVSEQIFGYKGLKIKLYYTAGSLDTYVGVEYDQKIDLSAGVEPDDIMENLRNVIEAPFDTNFSSFDKFMKIDETFRPYGELIDSFTRKDGSKEHKLEVYRSDTSDPKFLEYHKKVQTFVILYIDAANYVNPYEGDWKFFLMYEKYMSDNIDVKYAVVGYASVFEYYAYPSLIRPRISQIVILPPYRCMGFCSKFLNSIYSNYVLNRRVKDITVESPSEDFQRVRDFVDCQNCITLEAYSPEKLKSGFSEEMVHQACDKFKINKKQALRVYEILRLKFTNVHNDEEYQTYVGEIQERLLRPYKKRVNVKKFWSYFGSDRDDEFVRIRVDPEMVRDLMNCETELERTYEKLKRQYDLVINRLNNSL